VRFKTMIDSCCGARRKESLHDREEGSQINRAGERVIGLRHQPDDWE